MAFLNIFYFFVFYSFLGWLIESIFISISEKRFVNRGFLDGPFCPIYGFGALTIILFVFPFHHHFLLFFLMSILVTSIIEYFTSWFFEKFFNVSWWNYSDKPLNLNGRICFENCLYWGILSVLVLSFIHPSIISLSNFLSYYLGFWGFLLFIVYFIIDATDTFYILIKFQKLISQKINNNLHLDKKIVRLIKNFPNFKSKINNDFINELKAKIKKYTKKMP